MSSVARNELKEFLRREVEELRNIDNVEASLNPIKAAIELRASKKAYLRLKEILVDVTNYSEEGEVKDDPKDDYSV